MDLGLRRREEAKYDDYVFEETVTDFLSALGVLFCLLLHVSLKICVNAPLKRLSLIFQRHHGQLDRATLA